MNIALEQTEEHVNGSVTNRYGDAFIRGNNGVFTRIPGLNSFDRLPFFPPSVVHISCRTVVNSHCPCRGPRRIGWEVRYRNQPFEANPSSPFTNGSDMSLAGKFVPHLVLNLATDDHCPVILKNISSVHIIWRSNISPCKAILRPLTHRLNPPRREKRAEKRLAGQREWKAKCSTSAK